jgi:hypothetical protein
VARSTYRAAVAVVWGVLASGVARADPQVVVVAVVERDRGPDPARFDAAVQAAGEGALTGGVLGAQLRQRFGRFAPREDRLTEARAAVSTGCDLYFADGRALRRRGLSGTGPVEAHRALSAVVATMEADPDALGLLEDNRAAYLRALAMLARIDLEARREPAARAWAARAARLDPRWTPSTEEFPPPVVALFGAGGAPGATATLTLRLPREGCTVTVDGRPAPGTGASRSLALPAGAHRVQATCDDPSRVRALDLAPGTTTALALDPRLDATLRTDPAPALGYAGPADVANLLVGDAAAVGEALGATRVIAVGRESALVVDVSRARVQASVPVDGEDFGVRVSAALQGAAVPATPASTDPRVGAPGEAPARRTGAWVLGGGGVVALLGAGVMLGLRESALGDARALCPEEGGALRCPNAAAETEAAGLRDDASTWTLGAAIAGGVGVAALVGAVVWGTRPRGPRPVVQASGTAVAAGFVTAF